MIDIMILKPIWQLSLQISMLNLKAKLFKVISNTLIRNPIKNLFFVVDFVYQSYVFAF
jgi:hypothetical protein